MTSDYNACTVARELHSAVRSQSARGLHHSATWCAELLTQCRAPTQQECDEDAAIQQQLFIQRQQQQQQQQYNTNNDMDDCKMDASLDALSSAKQQQNTSSMMMNDSASFGSKSTITPSTYNANAYQIRNNTSSTTNVKQSLLFHTPLTQQSHHQQQQQQQRFVPLSAQQRSQSQQQLSMNQSLLEEQLIITDSHLLAKTYLDAKDYHRCAHTLSTAAELQQQQSQQQQSTNTMQQQQQQQQSEINNWSLFVRHYCIYMAGEKRKQEQQHEKRSEPNAVSNLMQQQQQNNNHNNNTNSNTTSSQQQQQLNAALLQDDKSQHCIQNTELQQLDVQLNRMLQSQQSQQSNNSSSLSDQHQQQSTASSSLCEDSYLLYLHGLVLMQLEQYDAALKQLCHAVTNEPWLWCAWQLIVQILCRSQVMKSKKYAAHSGRSLIVASIRNVGRAKHIATSQIDSQRQQLPSLASDDKSDNPIDDSTIQIESSSSALARITQQIPQHMHQHCVYQLFIIELLTAMQQTSSASSTGDNNAVTASGLSAEHSRTTAQGQSDSATLESSEIFVLIDTLQSTLFPNSLYLLHCLALAYYNARAFEQSADVFNLIQQESPFALHNLDIYSNILYVQEQRSQLSLLAARCMQLDKFAAETCCIVGNYYSLRGQHERAILYFKRALRRNPHCLAALTLMGHEYVELRNTQAANNDN
jgi:tetratricopeptide (TPR) repeat protein